jgi:hypothetical protein
VERHRTPTATPTDEAGEQKIVNIAEHPRFNEVASLEDIYPAPEAVSVALRSAISLLRAIQDSTTTALHLESTGDIVAADDAMQHVQAALPELLCCRTLGDGFGALVSALHASFQNLRGRPMTRVQVVAVSAAIQRLYRAPGLSFEDAMEQVEKLERLGLAVDTEAADLVAEWLIAQSVPGHDNSD